VGFWNALSVLAPVAPALSDAQDIRASRAKEQQDLELAKAQTTTQQMAAEGARRQNALAAQDERDRQAVRQQLGVPLRHYKGADGADYTDYFTPSGVKAVADAPSNEDRFQNYLSSLKKMGINLTPEQQAEISPEFYGGKALPSAKFVPLPGAAGQPQLGQDGKSYVVYGRNENGDIVANPAPAGYKPPEPKPGTPRPGLSGGRNVFGFYNPGKRQWQDAAGNALPDFQPQPSFAETGLFEPMASYNPQTQSIALGSFNRRTGGLTFSDGGGTSVPLPPAIAATIGKEFGTAREAQTRLKIMQQNAQDALATGNQQAMVSLLMNHIGMTLGAQKGTRVAKSIIDEARQSAPWVDTKLATIGHQDAKGDFIFDGLKGGITLTGEQIDQMVGLAKQRNDLQWQQVKDTGATYGVDLSGAIQQTQTGLPGKGGAAGGSGGGNAGQFVVIDPRGKPHRFDTQAQADSFRQLIAPKP
jgi:hypothetical protein